MFQAFRDQKALNPGYTASLSRRAPLCHKDRQDTSEESIIKPSTEARAMAHVSAWRSYVLLLYAGEKACVCVRLQGTCWVGLHRLASPRSLQTSGAKLAQAPCILPLRSAGHLDPDVLVLDHAHLRLHVTVDDQLPESSGSLPQSLRTNHLSRSVGQKPALLKDSVV